MTAPSRVLVALRVPAAPSRAFAVFTEDIARWWKPNGLFQFTDGRTGTLHLEPGLGGRLIESYADGSTFTVGEIHSWEPPAELALSWRHASFAPDQRTEVRVRFEPVDDGTRVVVEHSGWGSIPRRHAARHGADLGVFQHRLAEWWQDLLGRVRGELEAERSDP